MIKVSDYIISYFESQGVNVLFGYIGGTITHIVDSAYKNPNVTFIQTYHEQTAAIAAEGFAKESGKFGVAMSTSGPGAINMMTGIADAYFDSIPVVYITGQVNTNEYKYNKPIRQQGFQETDVISMVKPVTKYSKLIDNVDSIRYELEKAVSIATSGRKGPVLLDIPMDIQRAEIEPEFLECYQAEGANNKNDIDYDSILSLLASSKSPMLLLGGGCNYKGPKELVSNFLEKVQIPVVTSLMGRGCTDETYSKYIGMIGSYGNRCANMSLADVDLLLVLGSRLDTRQTGVRYEKFIKKGTIIHVDIDNDELENHRLSNRLTINSDIVSFLKQFPYDRLELHDYSKWTDHVLSLKTNYNQQKEIDRFIENKSPYLFLQVLNKFSSDSDVFCADIGQNQMWSAQTLELKKDQKFITSGGLAPMGFSLPVAIGIAFADNCNKTIYSINGDGGFHMAVQSLMLISQYNLPIKVIVMNNNALGMITQFQHLYFGDRFAATTKNGGYLVPSIESIAVAYNLKYYKLSMNELADEDLIKEIIDQRNCIIEYTIDGLTSVSPKLEYNNPIESPTPLLPLEEMNSCEF